MKEWGIVLFSIMTLAACSDEESLATKETTKEVIEEVKEENDPTVITIAEPSKKIEVTEPEVEVSEPPEKTEATESKSEVDKAVPLTLEDFNNRYKLDTEFSEPFIDGRFELKDGTVVNADWYFYLEGETFNYASGIFLDGQLVQAQLELKDGVTKEKVLAELGLSKEVIYDLFKPTNVVDVVVDKRFADGNIKRLPNE